MPATATRTTPMAKMASAEAPLDSLRIELRPREAERPERFEVAGLPADVLLLLTTLPPESETWQANFAVFAPTANSANAVPMLGDYRVEKDLFIFEPRFPLRPGTTYQARHKFGGEGSLGFADFPTPPAKERPPADLTAVYPSASALPENQLKFYLHFSAPMSRGEAYSRVHLLKASGEEVEFPFLELGEELWDESGTRFTLFFDPGRIKRGLKPREEMGPSLVEGESYMLVIDQEWLDAEGRPLKAGFKKSFRSDPPDDVQPDAKKWQVTAPHSETSEPLVASFNEPLDHAMLQRVLGVKDAEGNDVAGEIKVDQGETRWQLTPAAPWKPGKYALVIDAALEDLAGNSLSKPFEVDVFRQIDERPKVEVVEIPFEVP